MNMKMIAVMALVLGVASVRADVSLDGTWNFRFEEDKILETAGGADFAATDKMVVPGCWDVMPQWYLKHGTGLYRRTFTLDAPLTDAVLVVDGMGIRARFEVDGKDLGVHPYPYARLELPVGPLAAGEHTIFAAVDNVMDWPRVKLARPYYDFYFYGGFYHGVKLVEKTPKVFVRTLDFTTGEIEIELEGQVGVGARSLIFDAKNEVAATFKDGKAVVKVPDFKLWSPASPHLHTLTLSPDSSTSTSSLHLFSLHSTLR